MGYNPDIHKRQSMRLKGYYYSQHDMYFVTICTQNRECLFGDVMDGSMKLNDAGKLVRKWWTGSTDRFRGIELDEYVIMPNHFHGIIRITSDNCRGEVTSPCTPDTPKTGGVPCEQQDGETYEMKGGETPPLRKPTIGQIIAYFKYQTTRQINQFRNSTGIPVWQRNYHDRIIRNEKELMKIREYIRNNPMQWDRDKENPKNL